MASGEVNLIADAYPPVQSQSRIRVQPIGGRTEQEGLWIHGREAAYRAEVIRRKQARGKGTVAAAQAKIPAPSAAEIAAGEELALMTDEPPDRGIVEIPYCRSVLDEKFAPGLASD